MQCSKSCGGGTQTRPVTCRDHLGQTLPDHRCNPAGRPDYSQSCRTDPCPTVAPVPEKTYKWKTAAWTTVGGLSSTKTEMAPTEQVTTIPINTSSVSAVHPVNVSFTDDDRSNTEPTKPYSHLFVSSSLTHDPTLPNPTYSLPDPSPSFAASLSSHTTTDMTPEQSHTTSTTDANMPTTTPINETSNQTGETTVTGVTTLQTTTMAPLTASLTHSVSPNRPVTFDWNGYTGPSASSTSSTATALPVASLSLPQLRTYAYFANYYRFDSPTEGHSLRLKDNPSKNNHSNVNPEH